MTRGDEEDIIAHSHKGKTYMYKVFDKYLNRLGYGGGYYDRYISRACYKNKIIKIGVGFSYQKVKKVLINRYDKKMNLIITEKDFFK